MNRRRSRLDLAMPRSGVFEDARSPLCSIRSGRSEILAAAPVRSRRRFPPFVKQVIAVDRSGEMLQAARRRLREHTNVEVRRGELESLPIADRELDVATLMLVLHHLSDPAEVLHEAARALRTGGRLLICDMLPHDREEYRQQMGHVWLGFGEEQLRGLLAGAGFVDVRIVPLETARDAKGPALFAAGALRT